MTRSKIISDASDFDPLRTDSSAASAEDLTSACRLYPRQAPRRQLQHRLSNSPRSHGIPVPQLQGKTVREVTEECMKLGLTPVLVSTGIAVEQSPEAGAMILRGSRNLPCGFARRHLLDSRCRLGKVM